MKMMRLKNKTSLRITENNHIPIHFAKKERKIKKIKIINGNDSSKSLVIISTVFKQVYQYLNYIGINF